MFDAAIIGGGLAGCSAAIHLAKKNLRVVLFEANTYPHHKVCGEFLSPECAYLLDELGVMAVISALQPATITTVTISSPDNTVWESNLPGAAIGVSRYVLDDCLAKQATAQGVDLRQGTKVIGVSGNLDQTFKLQVRSPSGTEAISAKLVIGAQGKRSTLDRSLNRTFLQKHQPFVALKTHFYRLPLPQRT